MGDLTWKCTGFEPRSYPVTAFLYSRECQERAAVWASLDTNPRSQAEPVDHRHMGTA